MKAICSTCALAALVIVILMCTLDANAKIWRVNGNPGVDADFADIHLAVNDGNVEAGDTIIVEPLLSGIAYGSFNCYKRLKIFGSGYYLDQNDSTQALLTGTRVNNGSDFYAGSEGSLLSGFIFNQVSGSNTIVMYADSITVEKCFFSTQYYGVAISSGNNTIIRDCYFTGDTYNSTGGYYIHVNTPNNIITNNIFNATTINSHRDIGSSATGAALITNNVFSKSVDINNSFFTNNVFKATATPSGNSNTFNNNVFEGNPAVTGANNQFNVDMTTVFAGGSHPEEQFLLKAGSPAIGAGTGGVDCGAFGGSTPYVRSGMPPIPSIFFFSADSMPGIGTNTINVQIKAKVNK